MNQIQETLKHEVYLQRLATEMVNKKLFPSLDAAYKAIRLILLDAETITSPTKLNAVTREITKAVKEALQSGWGDVTKELEEVAVYDAKWNAAILGAVAEAKLKVPGKGAITDYINKSLMSLTSGQTPKVGTWAEFVSENVTGYAAQVNNLVKAGYVNGATVGQMTSAVKQFNDGLGKQQAETLARTGVRHYTENAREAMAQDNDDIIEARVYVSTFDNRTTVGCASLDGKSWKLNDDSYVRLPRHFNCRSVYVFKLKGEPLMDFDKPAVGSGPDYPQDADKMPKYKGKRDVGKFKVEQVSSKTGFGSWLRDQDETFVVDTLGAKRAELFLKGGLPIERMSDAFGRELTLSELMKKESKAFKKAGLL
jgi:SPP1 gp7 family putative phage head morphogenesis protein